MSEVNYEWNECILYQHRSIYVDEAQHAAHSRGRHTCAEHGCMSDQTMLLWFLASLSQRSAIVFHEKRQMASQCSEALVSVATLKNTNCLLVEKACADVPST